MFSNDIIAVENWLQSVRDLIQINFSKYTEKLLQFKSSSLLHIIIHVLLEKPVSETGKVIFTDWSWGKLEKDGVINLYGRNRQLVNMPFLFVQIYFNTVIHNNDSVFRFLDMVLKLRESRGFRSNEKCDAAVLAMHFLYYRFSRPSRCSVCLKEIFEGLKGDVFASRVAIPEAIRDLLLDDQLIETLQHHFNPSNVDSKIYIGTGNDPSGDVFFPLKVVRKEEKITIVIESKLRGKATILSKAYIDEHKKRYFHLLHLCYLGFALPLLLLTF